MTTENSTLCGYQPGLGEQLAETVRPGVVTDGAAISAVAKLVGGAWMRQIETRLVDQLFRRLIGIDFLADLVELGDLVGMTREIARPAHRRLEVTQSDVGHQ